MDQILDIMEKDEFSSIFKHDGNDSKKTKNKDEIFDVHIIYDAFLVLFILFIYINLKKQLCIEKISQLLFYEKGQHAKKIYETIHDKLGEVFLPIVMRSLVNFSFNYKSSLINQMMVKKIMPCYSEAAYTL